MLTPSPRLTALRALSCLFMAAASVSSLVSPAMAQKIEPDVPVLPSNPLRLCTEFEVVDGIVLFEGDIMLGTCRKNKSGGWEFEPRGSFAEQATGLLSTKAGVALSNRFWPDGVVPYVISSAFSEANDPDVYSDIQSAIRHWRGQSTVRLVPRTSETSYIEFVSGGGCSSFIGRIGGRQTINLVAGGACGFGSTVHEIGHALGFYHEQSRQDRDTYVSIVPEKIEAGREHNFNKYGSGSDLNGYDYGSIMHYGATFFSIDSENTINIVQAQYDLWAAIYGDQGIGQRRRLSVLDRQAADDMYNVCWNDSATGANTWRANEWRGCSVSCADPGRTREAYCHDAGGGCVGDGNCGAGSKPETHETCQNLLDCDFDTGNCGWDAVDAGDDFDWTPGYFATFSANTGPSADHTGGGHYMFTEVSSPRVQGDTALLTSVPFDISDGTQLTFWYHFYGAHLGSLEVEVAPCDGAPQTVLTINTGNTSSLDAWRQATVNLPAAANAQVRFKVTRGSGFSGDISIDDITVLSTSIFADGFESGNTSMWQ